MKTRVDVLLTSMGSLDISSEFLRHLGMRKPFRFFKRANQFPNIQMSAELTSDPRLENLVKILVTHVRKNYQNYWF